MQIDPRFQVDVQFNFELSQEQRDRLMNTIDEMIREIVGDIQKGVILIHHVPGEQRVRQ
jgi:Txe/YoeB family toxin of Txe-Axe toxin-antitoxin module